jgi:RES domain-containing protein
MAEFASWESYRRFSLAVIRKTRYVFDKETEAFLTTIVATCESRIFPVPKGTKFWRAQLHEPNQKLWEVNEPFGAKRMKPLANCKEGRINPKNIPCLYVALDEKTAMSEARPWIGAVGTLAEFETERDLDLVHCVGKPLSDPPVFFAKEPPPAEREPYIWSTLNAAFSEPITPTDSTADYAPTQVLAEVFKHAGYDGIMYGSSVDERGTNVALFDLEAARFNYGKLFQTNKVLYEFDSNYLQRRKRKRRAIVLAREAKAR